MTNKEIGSIIREARLSKKMTQNEVVGDFITRNMLSLIENGTATPSIRTLQYLAAKLQIPMSQFSFTETEHSDAGQEESVFPDREHNKLMLWAECKQQYQNGAYAVCLEQLSPFLAEGQVFYDEACALTALCHLQLARLYSARNNPIAAGSAAEQAAHFAETGIFSNQQVITESVLLRNRLAQEMLS